MDDIHGRSGFIHRLKQLLYGNDNNSSADAENDGGEEAADEDDYEHVAKVRAYGNNLLLVNGEDEETDDEGEGEFACEEDGDTKGGEGENKEDQGVEHLISFFGPRYSLGD
jgi:hypothetical protein